MRNQKYVNIEIPGSATVTIKGSDGKSVQVSQAMVAQAQLGLVQPSADGTVTLPGPDGKPVKIPQAALATAASSLPSMTAGKNIINNRYKNPKAFTHLSVSTCCFRAYTCIVYIFFMILVQFHTQKH